MNEFFSRVETDIPDGLRLDRYIAERLKILSRSQIKARHLEAVLDGKTVKLSRLLRGGEQLKLTWKKEESLFLIPQNLPLDILYENNRVIVVNKAQGMIVHPGAGNKHGTLANALLYRRLSKTADCGSTSFNVNGSIRPGIVHRLDKDTSGVIIAAWDEDAHAFLAAQFKARKVRKTYAALVQGCPKERSLCIDKNIVRSKNNRKIFTVSNSAEEGRRSITVYKTVRSWGKYSLLLLRPKTGRTHQIRVHMKDLGNPIIGDPLYGRHDPRFAKAALMLHAKSLGIVLPGNKTMSFFKTDLPVRFLEVVKKFESAT